MTASIGLGSIAFRVFFYFARSYFETAGIRTPFCGREW